jgi:acetyltransferase-like isoleucine patch superfamily enzyme
MTYKVLKKLVKITRPFVWKIARAYSLKVIPFPIAAGRHELIFRGDHDKVTHQVPGSCYFNTASGKITVGENTVFGENVMILTGKHLNIEEASESSLDLHAVPENGRDVIIGCGCYIGSGAIIIGPVQIGDFSVIGAGSIVTKNVPHKTFYAGNPARMIRKFK